jgi:tRNA dimethylallyltransferase
MRTGDPLVLALVGPTGAGKSALALEAAERLGAEIVAVDAFTVYRGMDIGTAKPSQAERARVQHHGVDLLHPGEECTVEWFQRALRVAIDGVLARGGLPLLVGGSGLYFRAVVDALEFPPTDPGVREAVERRYGGAAGAAHAALRRLDPPAAARMEPGNYRRAVRALEVLELTGRPFSDWRRAWDRYDPVYPGLAVVGVDVARERLDELLGERVDAMMAAGLLDEVRGLRGDPRGLGHTARQAIGYAELLEHLDGTIDLDGAVVATKRRTRRYARRQARWFAGDPRVQWTASGEVLEALLAAAESDER